MPSKVEGGLSGIALYAAIAVIVAWLLILLWLTQQTTATEIAWSRHLVILASMEAVAFGAAGALFATQIQRQRVADAKERADKAEQEASNNKDGSVKGKALADAVKAQAQARGIEGLGAGGVDEQAALLALANRLFPD